MKPYEKKLLFLAKSIEKKYKTKKFKYFPECVYKFSSNDFSFVKMRNVYNMTIVLCLLNDRDCLNV